MNRGMYDALALKVLNETGQDAIAEFLNNGNEQRAKEYLLGAVDRLWSEGQITDEEASAHYAALKVPQEDAARLRQGSKAWGKQ